MIKCSFKLLRSLLRDDSGALRFEHERKATQSN